MAVAQVRLSSEAYVKPIRTLRFLVAAHKRELIDLR